MYSSFSPSLSRPRPPPPFFFSFSRAHHLVKNGFRIIINEKQTNKKLIYTNFIVIFNTQQTKKQDKMSF